MKIKPINGKKVFIFLIKKESFDLNLDETLFLMDLIRKYDMKFATVPLTEQEKESFHFTDLAIFLYDVILPWFNVDIPKFAEGYLTNELSEEQEKLSELLTEYENLGNKSSLKEEYLKSWIDHYEAELIEKEEYYLISLRAQLIVKKTLDIINTYDDTEDTFYIVHFTSELYIPDLKKSFEEVNVNVIVGDITIKPLTSLSIKNEWVVN